MKKKILVTGITGSIGESVASFLHNEGFDVYGTTRSVKNIKEDHFLKGNIFELDLEKEVSLDLPDDLFAIIHCAAATSEKAIDPSLSIQINVEGTKKFIEHIEKINSKTIFVYISSMSVNSNNPSFYAKTKQQAEKIVMAYSSNYIIVRPAFVINPNGRGLFNKLLQYVKEMPIVPSIGFNKNLSTVGINDLSKVIILLLENKNSIGKVVEVGANEALDLKDILLEVSKRINKKIFIIRFPYWLSFLIADISRILKINILTKDNVYGLKLARKPDLNNLNKLLKFEVKKIDQTLLEFNFEGESR